MSMTKLKTTPLSIDRTKVQYLEDEYSNGQITLFDDHTKARISYNRTKNAKRLVGISVTNLGYCFKVTHSKSSEKGEMLPIVQSLVKYDTLILGISSNLLVSKPSVSIFTAF